MIRPAVADGQVAFSHQHGYLPIPASTTPEQTTTLCEPSIGAVLCPCCGIDRSAEGGRVDLVSAKDTGYRSAHLNL